MKKVNPIKRLSMRQPQTPRSKKPESFYIRLIAQKKQLKEVLHALKMIKTDAASENSICAYHKLDDYIVRILSAEYAKLFDIASDIRVEVTSILSDGYLNPELESVASSLLTILITLSRIYFSIISLHESSGPSPRASKSAHKRKHSFTGTIFGKNEAAFICRICEQRVPVALMNEHSQLCVRAHQSEFNFFLCSEKLRHIKTELLAFLNFPWPGDKTQALTLAFPTFYVLSLLDAANKETVPSMEAEEALLELKEKVDDMKLIYTNINWYQVISLCVSIIKQKYFECQRTLDTSMEVAMTTITHTASMSGGFHTLLSDFEFVQKISAGAYARVYLARKPSTGDLFAIKVLPKDDIIQKNQMRRVLKEKDILLKLNDKHMVNFYYSFTGKNNLYLVMEFVSGGDFCSLLSNVGCLEESIARQYTAEIVTALEFLRSQGVIHRDIKPDNILIDSKGFLKIADFGLSAMSLACSPDITEAKSHVGTPEYISPEMILSQPHSFETDYWSLGIMIYEMLTGDTPFGDDQLSKVFHRILMDDLDWSNVEISAEAKDLISRLLIRNPKQRLGSNGVYEIKQHPWFAGIDWEHLDDMEAPFVPSDTLTDYQMYFQQKYSFPEDNESDIREDLELSETSYPSFTSSFTGQFDSGTDSLDDDDITQFPTVSYSHLMKMNEEAAGIKVTRSASNLSDNESSDSIMPSELSRNIASTSVLPFPT